VETPKSIKDSGREPTDEELAGFYEKLATDKHSDGNWMWSNEHIDESFGRVQFMLEHLEPGMSVLECGCCDGGMSRHIANAVGESGNVTLIDISPTFVERAKEFLGSSDTKLEFLVRDARTFNTRRRYDVIVAMEILEHVPDPRQLLSNLYKLLKKNSGKILVTAPYNVSDTLGEHLHEFDASDVANIVGDSVGHHVSVEQRGNTLFAVIDKSSKVPYVP